MNQDKALCEAADKSGMSEKTARKYLKAKKLPSEMRMKHFWKTHKDKFERVWPLLSEMLETNPGLEANTLLTFLQREYPGEYQDTQLRTLQRRLKYWRATEGPGKEVMFEQKHYPGELSESDFTHMDKLGITIRGEHFKHMLYHFVLTYSNWEYVRICFSESFESFSEGLQESLWECGGVSRKHQIDQLSAAVHKKEDQEVFTERYKGLLKHYRMEGQKIQVRKPHENGDIEQQNYRFKKAVAQALMLRGSSDFDSRKAYNVFLQTLLKQLNVGRSVKFAEEKKQLSELPLNKCAAVKSMDIRVRSSSTISVGRNTYSVNSRLIGEKIRVKMYSERIEVWLGQKKQDDYPRLIGSKKSFINYHHIIDSLIKKPGAFANYRYREALFPTSRFRQAYDWLCQHNPGKSSKNYLRILNLAAKVNESKVDKAILWLIEHELPIEYDFVEDLVKEAKELNTTPMSRVDEPDIFAYDILLTGWGNS